MNEYLKNTLVLFSITLAVALLLSCTHFFTKDIIAQTAIENQTKSREKVLTGLEFSREENISNVWIYYNSEENIIGYAILAQGPGYGGEMELMIGMDGDYKILGIDVLSHQETPGLGSNAIAAITPQFIGKQNPFHINKEIEGVTGATITSKSIIDIVNNAVELLKSKE